MIVNGIEFIGRFDFSDLACIQFAWSGSTIKADFYGTNVSVIMNSSYYKDYFVVIIDGKIVCERLHVDHDGTYLLASFLENGRHTVELIKRTEFNIGTVDFKGFTFEQGYLVDRTESSFALNLEIIGDSLTCGFGSEGDETMVYDSKYDNAFLAYGSIAGRTLHADCRLISCSGYGLIRNYSGDMVNTMPTMIDKITPKTNQLWDEQAFTPDLVAINLGTNDFSNGYIPNKEQFVSAYIQLINTLFKKYPKCKVLCTIGPALTNKALTITREYMNEVVQYFPQSVYFLEYPQQQPSDGYGVSYHPSLKTHQKMADLLVDKIKELM